MRFFPGLPLLVAVAGVLISPALREPLPALVAEQPGLGAARPHAAGWARNKPSALPVHLASAAAAPRHQAPLAQAGTPAPAATETAPDTYELWRRWLRLVEKQLYQQIPIANALLAESLRSEGGAEIYQEIAGLLRDAGLSYAVRAQLVDLLGEIATPEALALLLELAGQGMESPMYAPALNSLSHIGENRWGGRFHEELSPLLEEAWKTADDRDWPYLVAVTRAIVGIGAPSGIGLMLDTLAGKSADPASSDTGRSKRLAAFTETPKVVNPAAVPVMRQAVTGSSLPSPKSSPGAGTSLPALASATAPPPAPATTSPAPTAPATESPAATAPTTPPATETPAPNPTDKDATKLPPPGAPAEADPFFSIAANGTPGTLQPNGLGRFSVTSGKSPVAGTEPTPGRQGQSTLIPIVIAGLENIGSGDAATAINDIAETFPEAKDYMTQEPSEMPTGRTMPPDPGNPPPIDPVSPDFRDSAPGAAIRP